MTPQPGMAGRHVASILNEAASHVAAGRHAEALRTLAEAVVGDPDGVTTLRLIGGRLLDLGADEAACLCFLHVLGLAPDDAAARARCNDFHTAVPPGWMPSTVTAGMVVTAIRQAADRAGPPVPESGDDGAPIDLVVTWVDGADPAFQARLAQRLGAIAQRDGTMPDPNTYGPQRFRDGGTLRHMLRSVEACLPWVGRVILVTDGQAPAWLDLRHPRLRLVRHAEIFPDPEMLPCFNSSAIGLCLHRIPGVGSRFLYLNDDMLFLREVPRRAFIAPDGQPNLLFGARWVRRHGGEPGTWHHQQAMTIAALEARLGERPLWRGTAHGPLVFARDSLDSLEAAWPERFDRTRRNPFRGPDDFALHLLYLHHVEAQRRAAGVPHGWHLAAHRDVRVIQLGQRRSDWRGALARALAGRPACVCVNDNCPDTPTDEHESAADCAEDLAAFLAAAWPAPSSFERS